MFDVIARECKQCPQGTFKDNLGVLACEPCNIGEHQDQTGQTTCKPCSPGTYSSVRGAITCSTCREGTYSVTSGSDVCKSCPLEMPYSSATRTACKYSEPSLQRHHLFRKILPLK